MNTGHNFLPDDSDGARIYAGSLDSEAGSLPVYWGVLRAARECEGQTMQANGADGLVIARAVYGSDGEVSGYVLVRIPQGGFGALLGGSFGEQNDVFLLDIEDQQSRQKRSAAFNDQHTDGRQDRHRIHDQSTISSVIQIKQYSCQQSAEC